MEFLIRFKEGLQNKAEIEDYLNHLHPNGPVILGAAYRLCREKEHAEDLVQETFYYALKNFHQLKDRDKCKYWLFSILRNLFLKDIKKRKNWLELEFDTVCENLHTKQPLDPENEYIQKELKHRVQEALDTLNERLKFPIILFYFENRSYKEISEILNIPIGTVMSRLARAKVHLKQLLMQSEFFNSENPVHPINQD